MVGKHWILLLCLAVPLLITCWAAVPPVTALTGSETQVTTNTADQIDPAISGDYIVWTDGRSGNKDIYLYSIAGHTEVVLTPGTPNDQYLDDVSGHNVVYTSVTSGGADIILYDLATSLSTPLTDGGDQYFPSIEGNHVVWVRSSGLSYSIMLADISAWTMTTVTSNAAYVDSPRVDGDWVVWEEGVVSYRQIRAYQISTGLTRDITTDTANHRRPDISGDTIVWSDDRNGNWDVYSYSLSTGMTTRLTDRPGDEKYARIAGNRVVWEDTHDGITEIWTLDLSTMTTEPVSPHGNVQILNAIDGNHIAWTESRFGNYDIFLFTIGEKPVADAGSDQTVHAGTLTTLDGSLSTDPGGHTLTYAWSIQSAPSGSTAVLSDATAQKPTITPDMIGDYTLRLIVNNGYADSDPATVTVHAVNQAPVADAGSDKTVAAGSTVTLDGSLSSDPDNDPLTYAWTMTAKPSGSAATLSGSTMQKPTFTADKSGDYTARLIVNDGYTDSAPATVTVHAANRPPVADAGPDQTVTAGTVVTLDGSGSSDPDGNTITYAWTITSRPAGSLATLSDVTAQKPTFTADKDGAYGIRLIVNDGTANSDPDTVTVTASRATITVPVDVEPGFCPNLIGVNMKGPILIVAIPGTSGLDATKINPATIRLSRNGIATTVSPRLSRVLDIATAYTPTSSCGCVKKLWDGKKDLVLVFDIGEVVTKLRLKDAVGTQVPLTISGKLKTAYGSTPVTGSDCVKILSVCNEQIGRTL